MARALLEKRTEKAAPKYAKTEVSNQPVTCASCQFVSASILCGTIFYGLQWQGTKGVVFLAFRRLRNALAAHRIVIRVVRPGLLEKHAL